MKKLRWSDLRTWQKAIIVDIALLEIGAFLFAWADLSRRSADQINGSKRAWRAALFLNGIGPLTYLIKGRKQSTWTEADMPDLDGQVAIVTGANSGIGYETTRALAQHGATVIMACRNLDKANQAAATIRDAQPDRQARRHAA